MADSSTISIVEDVRFLRPPQPFIWQDYIPLAVGLLCTAGTLALAAYLIRRRIRNGPNAKVRALRALHHARTRREERGDFWYLLRSNRILRDFFQAMFDIEAPAQTSRQFLESIRQVSILDEQDRAWLTEYLNDCDRIRYAGHALEEGSLTTFNERVELLITSLYGKKKHTKTALITVPEETSPFLPGTPVPVLSEGDEVEIFTHSKPEMDSLEAPVAS